MRVIEVKDRKNILPKLRSDIEKYGDYSDHNPYCLLYEDIPSGYLTFYFDFYEKGGMLVHQKKGLWRVSAEPIVPLEERINIIKEFLNFVFDFSGKNVFGQSAKKELLQKGVYFPARKVVFQDCRQPLKKKIVEMAGFMALKAAKPSFVSFWPVYNLSLFDENLMGNEWKRLRKIRNSFIKKYKVKIVSAFDFDKKSLKKLVFLWREQRKKVDTIYFKQYLRFIENGFPGFAIAKVILVDEKVAAIVAGWKIPNSNIFYPCINIHDYQYNGLSEFSTLDIFIEAKKTGYKYLDFGGSDRDLLVFKKKFHPFKMYKAYNFSLSLK